MKRPRIYRKHDTFLLDLDQAMGTTRRTVTLRPPDAQAEERMFTPEVGSELFDDGKQSQRSSSSEIGPRNVLERTVLRASKIVDTIHEGHQTQPVDVQAEERRDGNPKAEVPIEPELMMLFEKARSTLRSHTPDTPALCPVTTRAQFLAPRPPRASKRAEAATKIQSHWRRYKQRMVYLALIQ
ncbi:MAG: uncharacterized protein KVP18_000481 [Porospora cf. gigantea A]|uniref:uncharacterized protein n=1 Tax=Porospora cf. gigantea A TaxID=2853593 RepID=UPI00355A58F5|nr:MAG: hypothetical protein KVP18_000481 [Porospora cf. gigantea A]